MSTLHPRQNDTTVTVDTNRTTLITWPGGEGNYINCEIENSGASIALNLVELEAQDHPNGTWHVVIANTGWIAPDGFVLIASSGAMTLAAAAKGYFMANLGPFNAARLVATTASSSTTVNTKSTQSNL